MSRRPCTYVITTLNAANNMDTICAIATPAGGAIGIVRVSGPKAIAATAAIFRPAGKEDFSQKAGGTLTFGRTFDPATGETLDEVLVSLFRAPRSYTGEDSCEISCHGSEYILSRTMELLLANGCRMARPGEYTERAFLNGKMDLSQAEAVADLIASTTASAHRMAMSQMRGGFSADLRSLRDRLLHLTSLLELELDFSDHEDLEFASRPDLLRLADETHAHISKLCSSFRLGNALRRGIPVAIAGETNAGKSTLLNALVGEQRALVSNVRGTTRDTIEETITLGDTLVRLTDTAGLRDTDDEVEQMGIARAEEKIKEAEVTLWVIDATDAASQIAALAPRLLPLTTGHRLIVVINKRDIATKEQNEEAIRLVRAALQEVSNVPAPLSGTYKSLATGSDIQSYRTDSPLSSTAPALRNTDTAHCNTASTLSSTDTAHYNTDSTHCNTDTEARGIETISLSAHNPADISALADLLAHSVSSLKAQTDLTGSETIVSNLRHYEALSAALSAIDRVRSGLSAGLSADFVSQDLRECLHHLGEISGEVTTDDVLSNIFRNFCIGK